MYDKTGAASPSRSRHADRPSPDGSPSSERRSRTVLFVCNDARYFIAHRGHVAQRLLEEGWQVHVAAGGDTIADDSEFKIEKLRVNRLRFSPWVDLLLALQVARLVWTRKPDVVHFITIKPILFGGLACAVMSALNPSVKSYVATFPGLGRAFASSNGLNALRSRFVARLLTLIFARLNMIATFENAEDRDRFVASRIVPAQATRLLVGTGLDLGEYRVPRQMSPRGSFRVLWASRLIRGKRLDAFVEAARIAKRAGRDIQFLVAGYFDRGHPDNLSQGELAELLDEDCVTFLGHVSNVPELLGQVDAVVLPSSYAEGLPRLLIEAAAAGLPTIASNQAGCRRVTIHNVTGLILPCPDGQSIFDAVERLEADRGWAQSLGKNAEHHVHREGFDARAVQDAFLACYAK